MKKKILCVAAVAVLLAGAWIWRYISLNRYWESTIPDNYVTEEYAIGDTVAFGDNNIVYKVKADGYALRVDDFRICEYTDFIEENGITPDLRFFTPPERVGLLRITLFNESNGAEDPVDFLNFALFGIDMYFNHDYTLTSAMNPVLQGSTGTRLRVGEECSFVLVYDFREFFLSGTVWNNLEDYDLYFRVTSYPVTQDVKVQ